MNYHKFSLITLISITMIGLIAIPIGNPKFLNRAIALELCFAFLSFFVWRGYTKVLYACVPLAAAVIIGNSVAAPHVHLMMTFDKPLNATVLVIGGYVLQVMLIYFSLRVILEKHPTRITQRLNKRQFWDLGAITKYYCRKCNYHSCTCYHLALFR